MLKLPYASPIRRCVAAFILAVLCVLPAYSLFAQTAAENPAACQGKSPDDTATVKQYVFRTYSQENGECLLVNHMGKVVFSQTWEGFGSLTLGQTGVAVESFPVVENGTDVTGRGHPDMIVSLFTGGAHCCTTHFVFELAPAFRLLATLNDADDDEAHFERLKDGHYYYFTADWTFAYWPTCFACSPSEVVLLRWADDANGGAFHVALDKMQKPAPTTADWNKSFAAARKVVSQGDPNSIGTTLWQTVLDLIYTGHSDLAWKFVDAAGPKAQQKPFPTLTDFCSLLKQSPYWTDLGPSLQNPPPACSGPAPGAHR